MAVEIPGSDDLPVRKFSGVRQVVSEDVRGISAPTQMAADTVKSIGQTMEEEYHKQADFELEKAKAAYLVGQDQENSKYDQRNDYENIEAEWEEGTRKLMDNSTSIIKDADRRAEFENFAALQKQKSGSAMKEMAWGKEKDSELAVLSHDLNKLKDRIAANPSNSLDYVEAGRNRISSMYDRGYINGIQYEQMMRTFGDDTIKKSIQNAHPYEAKKLLEIDFIKNNLPVEDWAALSKQVNEDVLQYDAMAWVDENYTGDIEDSREGVASILDPMLRLAVEARLEKVHNTAQRDLAVNQKDLYQEWGVPIIDNREGATFDNIPAHIKDKMSPGMVQNLKNFEQSGRQAPANTPLNIKMDLFQLKKDAEKTGNWKPLQQYFLTNSSQMSISDQGKWGQVTVDGLNPEVESQLTFNQRVTAKFGSLNDNQKQDMLNAYDKWAMSEQLAGRPLDDTKVDNWMASHATKSAYQTSAVADFFSKDKATFELDEKEQAIRSAAINQLNRLGIDKPDAVQIGDTTQAIGVIKEAGEDAKAVHTYMLSKEVEFNRENAAKYVDAYGAAKAQVLESIARQNITVSQPMVDAMIKQKLQEQGL